MRKTREIQNISQVLSVYIKELFRLKSEERVSTSDFAKKFKVHPSTVTENFQRLASLHFLNYEKYKGACLTKEGIQQGELLLWKHRILEVFFLKFLGLSKEDACQESDKIDFFISANVIKLLCKKFNHPAICPCGFEIARTYCDL
jgi:DtxR family Mn-dependent transcriptional regulator